MRRRIWFWTIITLVVGGHVASAAPDYVVSIIPLAPVVEELAGPDREVGVLVGPGATPALYEPTARQIVALSRARALFVVGVPFETTFLPRVRRQLPALRVVDTAEGVARLALPGHDHGDRRHDHEVDPHVWVDPLAMITVGANVARALIELEPDRAAAIEERAAAREQRLRALHAEIESALAPVEPKVIAVFHPSFGHFAARYGFEQVAVEAGGQDPSPRHLAALRRRLDALDVDTLFVQPQFSPQRARTLGDVLDVRLVEIDPLDRDLTAVLRTLVAELGGVLEGARR